ncbi:MAG: phage tail assembly chaperone [Polymorphobacter sp.]
MSEFAGAARRAARVAAALLGWRPAEFWAATPAELRTALGLDDADDGAPATGNLLARLMKEFPDAG